MTQLTDELFAVEVIAPIDANDFWINNCGCIRYSHDNGRKSSVIEPAQIGEYLEKGNWSILGTVSPDAIDFDCVDYVKVVNYNRFENYTGGWSFDFTNDSFRSIITSKGLDNSKKYLIIKKEK